MRTIRPGVIRISTGELPAGERIAYCREVFGRKLFRVDIEPLPDSQVCADIILHALPGLNILSGTIGCGVRTARTRELISDGNDDLLLTVNLRGRLCVSQRGQQLVLDDKVAVLSSLGEMGEVIRSAPGHGFTLQVPRSAIVPIVRCIDAAVMRLIPSSSPALQLLTQYVTLLQNSRALVDPLLRQIAVKTIYDLVFAAIIAPREHGAFGQGVATARLAAIRADIIDNLSQVRLSAKTAAARHGLSARYVHLLFEETGQTFGSFVEEQRLKRAFALLTDPTRAALRISDIALQVGFAEHSTFHRAFRRFFGDTPGDVRARSTMKSGGSIAPSDYPTGPTV
jgi:AraC-like DNA-binding protein